MKLLVVGSLNIDHTFIVENFPNIGETIDCKEYRENIGGKGINQAYAASKVIETRFIGKINERDKNDILQNLPINNNMTYDFLLSNKSTGSASIYIDKSSQNEIVINHGANFEFNNDDLNYIGSLIKNYDGLLIQEEINEDFTKALIDLANKNNLIICLNPAPFHSYTKEFLSKIDILTPNETEFKKLFGYEFSISKINEIKKIFNNKFKLLIVTLGDKGAFILTPDKHLFLNAFKVKSIDTVGAGDTFNGFFFAKYLLTKSIKESVLFANKASSIAVTRVGTLNAVPELNEIIF